MSDEGTRDERVSLFVKVAAVLLLALCAQGCALVDWMMERMLTFGVGALTQCEKTPGGGVPR